MSDMHTPLVLREQKKAQTRSNIVDASVGCFTELGYSGASTREIAKRAGVGQGLISYHFESKEALWKEAVEQVFLSQQTPFFKTPTAKMDNTQLRRAFIDSLYGYAQHCIESPDLAMLLYHEAGQKSHRLGWLIEHHFIPSMQRLKPMYELGIQRNLLRDMPFNVFAFSLTGVINTHFALHEVYHSVTGEDPRDKLIGRELIEHISGMFLARQHRSE